MTTKQSIDEAMRVVRNEERPALLAKEEIEQLVSSPLPQATSSVMQPPTSHLLHWTIGGLALVATTAGIVWLAGRSDTQQPPIEQTQEQAVQSPSDRSDPDPAALPPSQERVAPAAEPVSIATVSPTPSDLTRLGLSVSGSQLQYRDGSSLVTVTTSGISVVDEGGDVSTAMVPRMVTLFRQGTHFAAWWDREDDAAAQNLRLHATMPNDLVPMKITLKDPSSPMFREADVILWYPAFRRGLDQFKQQSDAVGAIGISSIYPNPLQHGEATLRVTFTQERSARVDVFDLQGATVLHLDQAFVSAQGESSIRLPLETTVPTGMYLVVITTTAGERITQRLMIER
ncbi:hypothetical protein BH10BAC6_BH10BAC6_15300 [soil metagenome]